MPALILWGSVLSGCVGNCPPLQSVPLDNGTYTFEPTPDNDAPTDTATSGGRADALLFGAEQATLRVKPKRVVLTLERDGEPVKIVWDITERD